MVRFMLVTAMATSSGSISNNASCEHFLSGFLWPILESQYFTKRMPQRTVKQDVVALLIHRKRTFKAVKSRAMRKIALRFAFNLQEQAILINFSGSLA